VGWTIPEAENARLQNITDPEVVLEQRPTQLLVKLKAPTNKLQGAFGEGARMAQSNMHGV